MDEPSPRKSRLALAGGLIAIVATGGAGFLLGRGTSARDNASSAPTPTIVATQPAVQPTVSARSPNDVMTRGALIALATQAGDALASGQGVPADVTAAVGKRFELRLSFGCQGPAEEGSDAAMRWRYDAKAQALRVQVAPTIWNRADLVPGVDGTVEGDTVEGFWIARPWTTSEACPAMQDSPVPVGVDTVTLPGQTLAVAQFFDENGARQDRRNGKPYETVVRMSPEMVKTDRGFQLRVRGRIANIPGRGPVVCRQPAGSEQRPICVIAITADDVAIDNPMTGETLATWNVAVAGGAGR